MVYISGIGVVGTFGRGLECLESSLLNGEGHPVLSEVHGINNAIPICPVNKDDLKEKALSRKMRRADKFSKMAAIAAYDALIDSEIAIDSIDSSMGIILSTGFGPHSTTFDFLDGYIDYGENAVSPTSFSHSVHNAAASYISSILGVKGPTQTIADFNLPFQNALLLAQTWLEQGRCKRILLGCVDELGPQMEYVFNRKFKYAHDGKIQPFAFSEKPLMVPGEGSVFFMLSAEPELKKYCKVSSIEFNASLKRNCDIMLLDTNGMSESEYEYKNIIPLNPNTLVAGYAPVFGSMKISAGLHCAVGALMIKKQCLYPCFKSDNPYKANIITDYRKQSIKTISCLKFTKNNSLSDFTLVNDIKI